MGTVRKIGKNWWIDYRLDGKRYRKRIGKYKEIAKLALADIEVKIARSRAGFAILDKKLSEYVPQFLSYIRIHSKPLTLKRYVPIVRNFTEFLEALPEPPVRLSKVTPSIIEQYKLHRLNFIKPQTINFELTFLHHFFRYACEMKYIKDNPTQNIRKIRRPKRKAPRFLSKEEVSALLGQCDNRYNLEYIVKILLNTGMRWGELRNLEWSDIDWNERVIHIRIKEDWSPKGGTERKVPINKIAEEILLSLSKKNRWVLTTTTGSQIRHQHTRERLMKACQKAQLSDVTLHILRHTFASHLVMAGVDLATVSKLLGHKDISTTMIYSHLSQDHLRGAVEKLEF